MIDQLAGDLHQDPTVDQRVATGFHRMTTCNVEAGVHPEANRVNQVVDRVNTTATVFLGTTIECAQCQLSMRIDLGRVQINRPMPNPAELWAMPSLDGLPMVDLGDPNLQFTPAAASPLPGLPPSMARQTLPTAISSRLSHPLGARNRMLR